MNENDIDDIISRKAEKNSRSRELELKLEIVKTITGAVTEVSAQAFSYEKALIEKGVEIDLPALYAARSVFLNGAMDRIAAFAEAQSLREHELAMTKLRLKAEKD